MSSTPNESRKLADCARISAALASLGGDIPVPGGGGAIKWKVRFGSPKKSFSHKPHSRVVRADTEEKAIEAVLLDNGWDTRIIEVIAL